MPSLCFYLQNKRITLIGSAAQHFDCPCSSVVAPNPRYISLFFLHYLWLHHFLSLYFQHFPMYRISDEVCTESDAAPLAERSVKFRERWDCLSRESSEYLVDSLEPRAVLGGHTHHACYIMHTFGSPGPDLKKMVEYSVPSFSWRNRDNPSFMLVSDNTPIIRFYSVYKD